MLKQRAKWLVAIIFVLVAVTPVFAQETYIDPAGQFMTQIPAGWADESTPDYGLFTSGGASVYLVSAESDEVQAGIEAAAQRIAPDFDAQPVASNELPLPNGVWTQNVYAHPDSSLEVALAQVNDGVTYVIFVTLPDQDMLVAKQGDLNSILSTASIGTPVDLSDQQPAALADDDLAQISAYVKEAMAHYGVIGAAVAIVQQGEVVYSEGFGTVAKGDETPVNDQTLFMIGSTSKSMTTMMTATLVDDGIVDWDTPVTDILPDFTLSDRAATGQIELRDLFNMSSGIPRFDMPLTLEAFTPAGVQAEIATIPLAGQPGEVYGYSNFMVALGGYTDAVAAGADLSDAASAYSDLMETRVFEPIGMASTTADFDTALENANHAMPHSEDPLPNEIVPIEIDIERTTRSTAPAGGIWSNAEEMGQYLVTQMNHGIAPDGTLVVSEENLLETWKPGITMPSGEAYGMGLMVGSYKGQPLIHHGGNTSGFTTDFAFLPDADLGMVVLSNVGLANSFTTAVRERVFETAFGLEHTADAYYAAAEQQLQDLFDAILASVPYLETPIGPEAVADFLGHYERGVELTLDAEGNLVIETIFIDYPLLPTTDPNVFATGGVLAGYLLTFDEVAPGEISLTIDSLLGPYLGEPQSLILNKID